MNLSYQVTDWSLVGGDSPPPGTDDVSLLVNHRVFPENDGWRLALILETSNDDFGDINSGGYCPNSSKYLFDVGEAHVSLHGGATNLE